MRVVGGKYKGRRFNPPKNFPSRPTTDFAKEALFNILANRYNLDELNVLDLFAGTGSISLEFLSREAKSVTSMDNHPVSYKHLQKLSAELKDPNWKILREDAFQFIEHTPFQFDLIFADPPFAMQNQQRIAETVFTRKLLTPDGVLIIEHGRENSFENITWFKESRNYGGVHFSFFEVQ